MFSLPLPARLPSWRSGEAEGCSRGVEWSLAGCWEAPEGGREEWLCIAYTLGYRHVTTPGSYIAHFPEPVKKEGDMATAIELPPL
jgi:hypothetical protein